jgi:predicted dehydrogenase
MEWFEAPLSTTNYRELLDREDVDAVYIAVPHNLHEQIYCDAIRARKHVFAEKPFGIDLAAATQIQKTMAESPEVLVRCSSEFPFFPRHNGSRRWLLMVPSENPRGSRRFLPQFRHGPKQVNQLEAASCDMRRVRMHGRLGAPRSAFATKISFQSDRRLGDPLEIVEERPDGKGGMAPCETWDNATLLCNTRAGYPMTLEMERISPGDTNSWYLNIYGTKNSVEFSTTRPKTLRTLPYEPGRLQSWREEDLGYETAYPTITGGIFEFGFSDAILQMWASFVDEVAGNTPKFQCATPAEASLSHQLFTSALESHRNSQVVSLS